MLARTSSLPNHGKAVVDDARLETGSENEEGKRMVAKQLFSFFSSQCMENEMFFLQMRVYEQVEARMRVCLCFPEDGMEGT